MTIPDVETISVTLKGDTAYVGDLYGKIVAIDISNRANPVVIGTYVPPVLQTEVYPFVLVVEDTALYSVNSVEMTTYSIADPSSIGVLSIFTTGEEFNKVIVKNGLAYVTSGFAGLWVVDVSDPLHPRRVGNLRTAGYAYDILIDSTIAYLSLNNPRRLVNDDLWNGIWTIDVSRPDSMRMLGTYMTIDAFNISKSGLLLFVTHGNDVLPPQGRNDTTLTILNVADPSNMQFMGRIVAGEIVREIASRDSIAFVATASGFGTPNPGLEIYDCRGPANPQLLSTTLSGARGVSVNGNHAYVHRGDSSFVLDITDLTTPMIVGRVRNPGSGSFESVVTGNLVFWTNPAPGRFGALDVSNPSQPRTLFVDARAPYGSGIDIVGDTIYVTDSYEGLRIFRYKVGPNSVGSNDQSIVETMRLFQNYPNPFNPATEIRYRVSEAGFVTLKVYDVLGREVAMLVNEKKQPGWYTVRFEGTTLPSGIYIYRRGCAKSRMA
jgi:hypothetical protein